MSPLWSVVVEMVQNRYWPSCWRRLVREIFGEPWRRGAAAADGNRRRGDDRLAKFGAVTAPLEATLKDQPYCGGATATYADYVLFSVFQYARLGCSDELVAEGTALRRWRDELARAFDGLGNRYPGHPGILA